MSYLLHAKGIKKDFGAAQILKGIDFAVEPGEFVSIMGPSGSGKSTLLYILNGLEKPTEGVVDYKGKNLFQMSRNDLDLIRCQHMGFIFQFYNLIENLTVEENIILPAVMCGKSKEKIKSQLQMIMEFIGIQGKEKSFPAQLSGGQQQRVSLARAVINKPEIIFADEPTGSLDSSSGKAVMDLLKKINIEYGTTIVQVTHDFEKAVYADRIVHILDGTISTDEAADK